MAIRREVQRAVWVAGLGMKSLPGMSKTHGLPQKLKTQGTLGRLATQCMDLAAGAVQFRFRAQTSYTWLFSTEQDADYCLLRLFTLPSAGDSSSYLGSGG